MPSVYEFAATVGPHSSQRWWTGGNGFYSQGQFPRFDVRIPATPAVFPKGTTGDSPALTYKDFACSVNDTYPYNSSYYLTVQNDSDIAIGYRMRVYVP
jgi:hypothetical protein